MKKEARKNTGKMFGSIYPDTVCWRITSSCNRNCPFCYRPDTANLRIQQAEKILDLLHAMNTKYLGITGGEPLTRNYITRLLEYAKGKGFKICLATNADFFKKHREEIFRCVDAIGLPLESPEARIHDSLRGNNSLRNIKLALRDILENSDLPVYFTTVLTSKNRNDMEKIERVLSRFKERVIYWKIYEIVDYKGREHQKTRNLRISAREMDLRNLGRFLGKDKIFYLPAMKRCRSYFLINPNGDVVVPRKRGKKTEDLIIGNLLKDDYKEILGRWRKETDLREYRRHLCALKLKESGAF